MGFLVFTLTGKSRKLVLLKISVRDTVKALATAKLQLHSDQGAQYASQFSVSSVISEILASVLAVGDAS